jgi:hypothetical protein
MFEDDMKRYFTWAEANALVPRLAEIFGSVAQLRSQLRSTYEKLDALGFAPNGPNAAKESDNPFVDRLRGLFSGFYEALTEQLRLVEELGAQVKDIDTGLVDFFYKKDGREVLLCWRYGEHEIAFYHELETGFAGRRPLEAADRGGGRTLH